jgi:long-chain acyl-CoA synthetase
MAQIAGSLSTPIPAHAPNLARSILDRLAATPNRSAFQSPRPDGTWETITWAQAGDEMIKLGAGFIALGLQPEDRVAIASSTRLEWVLADAGVMLAGGANTTIYPSTADEDFGYIVSDSGARYLVAENHVQAQKALRQRDQLPELTKIVVIDGDGDGDMVLSWNDLRELGAEALRESPHVVEDRVGGITPESLATIIYTSGTTGRPKGVELPHSNWVFVGSSVQALDILFIDDVHYLWLPLSHVFGKVLLAAQYQIGLQTAVDGRVDKIVTNLPVVQPTVMCGVPRIFEKIFAGARSKGTEHGGPKAAIFTWAFDNTIKVKRAQREGRSAGPLAGIQLAVAEKLVFSKIKALMGGRIRLFVSGSAALNGDVASWFDAAGMPVLEAYGLTENTATACVVRPENIAFGVVGKPFPGTEVKIADDGEVLLRGPHIMRGYRNNPQATAEALLGDGWLATGDIGVLDDQGHLKITDRKKDLVKTSGGKYIAPGQIAAQFKVISSLASNLVVHANNRNYATALVSLDPEALKKFAADRGLTGDYATLAGGPEVREVIQADIDTLNAQLNRWETIKKFTVLPRDLTEDDGELTASLKVKRKVVEEHFADLLDAMYS